MTSPRNRGRSTPQPSDRRMRRQGAHRGDRRMERPRGEGNRRRNRLIIAVGATVLLIVGGIIAYGVYDQFVAPFRVLAARVGDTHYTQGDLVKRLRMLQAASVAQGQTFDFATVPFDVLLGMANAEMMRRAAPGFNVQVTNSDVDFVLRQAFAPTPPEGQDVRPGQIDREYRENYQTFLNSSQLSDGDYRNILEERIYRAKLREKLGEQVPSIDKHVEVQWIKLASPIGPNRGTGRMLPASEILKKLEDEPFEGVVKQHSVDDRFSDENGYVGWIPKGAFPTLDETLFGTEEEGPLAHNVISEPLPDPDGSQYILKVLAGPEDREISPLMREILKDQALEKWILDQQRVGAEEGWWEINFDSAIYQWAAEQLRQSAPRVTPPFEGQG